MQHGKRTEACRVCLRESGSRCSDAQRNPGSSQEPGIMQRCGEFRDSKEIKRAKRTRQSLRKGEAGCVLGGGGDGNGWERIKPGAKSRTLNQREPHNRATHAKRKPAKTMFPPVLRKGQKDLVTPAAPGAAPQWEAPSTSRGGSRDRRGRAPLALAHLSASGFGVDVGTAYREWGSAGVGRFRPKSEKGAGCGRRPSQRAHNPSFLPIQEGYAWGAEIAGNLSHLLPCVAGVNQSFASEYTTLWEDCFSNALVVQYFPNPSNKQERGHGHENSTSASNRSH